MLSQFEKGTAIFSGKIKIEKDDLLIIIGRKNEVIFSEDLKNKIKPSIKNITY